jgi:CBS domain-containing protein
MMKAADVMTIDVLTVRPETQASDIAALMLERGVSAVPVVDDQRRVLGVVSEGDLMRRVEAGTERRRSWWLTLFASNATLADEYVKSRARRAKDVMTAPPITVGEDMPIAEIAGLLERHRIKRAPVVRNGILVGIVSRANLLRALATFQGSASPTKPDDRAIREAVLAELSSQRWATTGGGNVVVTDGVVHLWGAIASEEERRATRVAAENVPGVRSVRDHMSLIPLVPAF